MIGQKESPRGCPPRAPGLLGSGGKNRAIELLNVPEKQSLTTPQRVEWVCPHSFSSIRSSCECQRPAGHPWLLSFDGRVRLGANAELLSTQGAVLAFLVAVIIPALAVLRHEISRLDPQRLEPASLQPWRFPGTQAAELRLGRNKHVTAIDRFNRAVGVDRAMVDGAPECQPRSPDALCRLCKV